MEELQYLPLPEATEDRYPEPDWHKRFLDQFDWFRAQAPTIRYSALMQWQEEGTAHQLTGEGQDPYNRCELYYCERGKFFVQIGISKGMLSPNMSWFIHKDSLSRYGVKVISKFKQLALEPPKTQD